MAGLASENQKNILRKALFVRLNREISENPLVFTNFA